MNLHSKMVYKKNKEKKNYTGHNTPKNIISLNGGPIHWKIPENIIWAKCQVHSNDLAHQGVDSDHTGPMTPEALSAHFGSRVLPQSISLWKEKGLSGVSDSLWNVFLENKDLGTLLALFFITLE